MQKTNVISVRWYMRGYRARKKHLPDAPHSDVTAEMQRRELAAMGDIEH